MLHIKEKITTHVRDTEDTEILKTMFYKKEYSKMIEYVEGLKYKYDGELNIKELKKNKEKTKKVYTFKQGSLDGYLNLKKILENKEISELIYR